MKTVLKPVKMSYADFERERYRTKRYEVIVDNSSGEQLYNKSDIKTKAEAFRIARTVKKKYTSPDTLVSVLQVTDNELLDCWHI